MIRTIIQNYTVCIKTAFYCLYKDKILLHYDPHQSDQINKSFLINIPINQSKIKKKYVQNERKIILEYLCVRNFQINCNK